MEPETETDWVRLLVGLPDMAAEMTRGYLESQGVPVQLRQSQKGASMFRALHLTPAPVDLYVPENLLKSAIAAINNMPKMEETIGDGGNFVLVYDEDGELHDLELTHGGVCPACGGEGIEHHVPESRYFGLIMLLWLGFLIGVTPLYRYLSESFSEGAAILVLMALAGLLLVFSDPYMRRPSEKWYCGHCKKEWHK